jgi:zinc protease
MFAKLPLLLFCLLVTNIAYSAPQIQHWTTENGARVYFVPAHEIPMVDVQIVFDAGAARDGDKPGMALMTNALLAEGAGKLNADAIAEKFDEVGAQFGNESQRDMSAFSLRSLVNKEQLTPALNTLALILNEPTFPQDAFAREKNQILIALQGRKQSPDAIAEEAFYKAVYHDHPYSTLAIGTEQSVKALQRENLIDFYKKYFVGRNATVAIVGDLDHAQAQNLAETLVGKLPQGSPAPELPKVDDLAKADMVKIQHPSTQTHILVGQPGMSRGDPDYFVLYLGNHILGGSGLVSRISEEVREKRGLSYSAYSYFAPMRRRGPYIIGLQTKNESADEALQVLRDTIKKFVDQGPTKEELEAAKKNITGGFPLRISSNKKIVEYIAMIGFYKLPLDYLDTFNNKIEAITLDQVKEAFKRRINPDKMATVIVGG